MADIIKRIRVKTSNGFSNYIPFGVDAENIFLPGSDKSVQEEIEEINENIIGNFKSKGSCAFSNLPSLVAVNEGFVYNISDAFTTTSDFCEGAGHDYSAGANVVIINIGTDSNPSYKYDVLGGGGVIDTSDKVSKSGDTMTGPLTIGSRLSTATIGRYSLANGTLNKAPGDDSFAGGYNVTASGSHSHAEGEETVASGENSHAEGYGTVASGIQSHAEGQGSVALQREAHVEGSYNIASGVGSHAEGIGQNVSTTLKISGEVGATTYSITTNNNWAQIEPLKKISLGAGLGYPLIDIISKDSTNRTVTLSETLNPTSALSERNVYRIWINSFWKWKSCRRGLHCCFWKWKSC